MVRPGFFVYLDRQVNGRTAAAMLLSDETDFPIPYAPIEGV